MRLSLPKITLAIILFCCSFAGLRYYLDWRPFQPVTIQEFAK